MKRDMDLVRKILVHLESKEDVFKSSPVIIEGYDVKTVSYHLKLMFQAGLIEAHSLYSDDRGSWSAKSLTWNGHEFLNAVKQDSLWNDLKTRAKGDLSDIPFQVLMGISIDMAKIYFREKLGLS
ncbi:DUF2513 domain-containing protein [Sutcliffiella cohnii]